MSRPKNYFEGFESKILIQTIIYDAKHSKGRGCGFIGDDGTTYLLHSFENEFKLEVIFNEGYGDYLFDNETELYEFLKYEVFED